MRAVERAKLIRRYREGPQVLEAAVAGLGDADLGRRPEDGGWTAREVVHHVADILGHELAPASPRTALRFRPAPGAR